MGLLYPFNDLYIFSINKQGKVNFNFRFKNDLEGLEYLSRQKPCIKTIHVGGKKSYTSCLGNFMVSCKNKVLSFNNAKDAYSQAEDFYKDITEELVDSIRCRNQAMNEIELNIPKQWKD